MNGDEQILRGLLATIDELKTSLALEHELRLSREAEIVRFVARVGVLERKLVMCEAGVCR